jgi:hypothetical protein
MESGVRLIQSTGVQRVAEIGVYRVDFAAEVLQRSRLFDRVLVLTGSIRGDT